MGPIRSTRRKRSNKKDGTQPPSMPMPGGGHGFSSTVIAEPLDPSNDASNPNVGFRISRKTFNYICSLVREELAAKSLNHLCLDGIVLSLDDQVAVALTRLASGESLLNVGKTFRMNQATVSQVTWRFIEAMEARAMDHLRWPNAEEIETIKCKFEDMGGLPNCCGAIDTTHVLMTVSSNEVWVDQENNNSMVLQAVVDSDMRFRDIVTGIPGCMNDVLVLQSSGFYKFCNEGSALTGTNTKLSDGSEAREYIIGDLGFPLLQWLLTPYPGTKLSDSETEFNRRHFATTVVARRALARLKNMWKILQGVLWRPDKHRLPRIILVCCLLHNIIIYMGDAIQDEMPLSYDHDPNYKQQVCDVADENGTALRDGLSRLLRRNA